MISVRSFYPRPRFQGAAHVGGGNGGAGVIGLRDHRGLHTPHADHRILHLGGETHIPEHLKRSSLRPFEPVEALSVAAVDVAGAYPAIADGFRVFSGLFR